MEISGVGGAKGGRGAGAPRGETGSTRLESSAELRRAVADVLRISQQGREKVKSLLDPQWIRDQVDSANQQAEAEAKALKTQRQCQLIASRVMAGDKVPVEDLKYLAEHDMKLYSMAMAMKRNNPDPKEHKRVSEDEEAPGTADAAQTASPSVPAGSPEGGAAPDAGGGEA